MTTSALTGGFAVCQTRLGAKIHDPKDPGADLGPMFRQVVGTILRLADRYATPLPQLTEEVKTLAARVDEHLKKMGAGW